MTKLKGTLLQPVTLKPNALFLPLLSPPPRTVTQELCFKQNQTLPLPHDRPPVHLVNRKPLFIFSAFQTLSSSSANLVSDPVLLLLPSPPPLVTSATGSMTSFRRWQPGVRKERQIPKHTDRGDGREEKERGREAGGREGGGQTDKSSSRGSVLARNVKQFSQASSLPS